MGRQLANMPARLFTCHACHRTLGTISRKSKAGLPDLILVRRGRCIFAELKTEKGKLRPAQADWVAELEAVEGVEVYVWRPSMWDTIAGVLE